MTRILVIIILLLILFWVIGHKEEHLDASTLSTEAIQNIASVYADTKNEAVFNNVKVTGKINGDVNGNITGNVKGNVDGNLKGDVIGNGTGNVTGDVTGDVTGNLKGNVDGISKYSENSISINRGDWGEYFRETAKEYFKRSDYPGTLKTFIFKKDNYVMIITYVKVDNSILEFNRREYKNYNEGGNWKNFANIENP